MKRLFTILFLTCVFAAQTKATHIVGGNLNYTHISGNNYRVTLVLYRDCTVATNFDDPAAVGVFDVNGNLVLTISMDLDSVVALNSTINSSCVAAPSNICVEAGFYTDEVELPPIAGGYTITYQRCCRNAIIQNIDNPGDVGATLVATIPGTNSFPANSNPIWNQLPPIYVCVNLPFTYNHSAFDLDGDQLVYALYNPLEGASAAAPQPNPPAAPPYTPVPYSAGFGVNNMLGGTSNFSIDPATGVLTAVPGTIGNFLVGMVVQEFRNGVLLGETMREFQLNVVNCQAPVALPADINSVGVVAPFTNCTPFVQFNATNSAGFSIAWNFGDPSTVLDVSNIQNPTYTYPGPGVYPLTLVVFNPINPNDPLCSDTVVQNITVQPPVTPDAGLDVDTCSGSPVQIGGPAVAGHTYQWNPAAGLANPTSSSTAVTAAANTTYTVTETDQVGCTGTDQVVVTVLAAPNAQAGADATICNGATAQLQAGGGTTFSWTPSTGLSNPNIANPIATPSATTTYVVTVTGANGCEDTDEVTITVNGPQLNITPSAPDICVGASTQLTASGAVNYTWSPPAGLSNANIANPVATPGSTTTYTVTATDASGCVVSEDVVVTVQPLPIPQAGQDAPICTGDNIVIGAPGQNGLTYTWSPATGLSNPNIANPTATPGSTTTYTVTASTSAGCEGTDAVVVTVNPLPNINAGPANFETCAGTATQLNANGGTSYVWSPAAGLSNATIQNPVATVNNPTTYTVTGTDANGCENTDQINLNIFTVQAQSTGDFCVGASAQLSANGGQSWVWSPPTGLSSTTAQNPTASPSVTTTYTVSANNGFCNATDAVTQEVNQLPNVQAGTDQAVCPGSAGQLNATGAITFVWSPATGLSNPNIANPIVTIGAAPSTYTVSGTDANGCVNTDQITVSQLTLPPVSAIPPFSEICAGFSVNLLASGGSAYSWDPAIGLDDPTIANPVATPAVSTIYTVTVTQPTGNLVLNGAFDAGNAGFSSDYIFDTDLQPEGRYSVVTDANSVHPAFSGLGHTGNNPDNFMVVNGAGTPGLNVWCQTVPVSTNTDYSFSTWVTSVVGGSPAILQFSINGTPLATPFNAPPTVGVYDQFFQVWNSGTATTATICILNQNTTTGGNDFALDDISFTTVCTQQAQATIDVNPLPTPDAGADVEICRGDNVQLTASTGLSSYLWAPPIGLNNPTISDPIASPFGTTTYTLFVEDDLGCQGLDQVVVTINPLPEASAGGDSAVCVGNSLVLQGTGGTAYNWSPGTFLDNANASSPTSTPTTDITYIVNVTDDNGCENTDTVAITVNPLPVIATGVDSMLCIGGSLVLHATGGINYQWSPAEGLSDPNSADPTATPVDPVTYTVTGTDVNGCSETDAINLDFFVASAGPDSIVCLNQSVQAYVSGGATFLWSPPDGVSDPTSPNPLLTPNGNTTYTVTVTSQFGCVYVAQLALATLSLPSSQFVASFEPTCEGVLGRFDNQSQNSEGQEWMFGDGSGSGDMDPQHMYPPGQGYVVTLITYNNDSLCSDTITIDYTGQWLGNDTIDITFSNAITPDNDGLNDCFMPYYEGNFSGCYDLNVFNRWGGHIFESTGGDNHCWDGRNKAGNMVDPGTYYYIVHVKGYEKTGYVTLIH